MPTTATAEPTTVGAFTYDPTTSTVSGPASYMRSDDYARCIAGIMDGTSHTFRACMEHSPTPEIALLVTIQTNYAGWHGMETFNRARGV
jgi:isoaspartyl peptidase/L-asparaginase-like protein (Ntn-hydrolase superfamily)